MSMGTRIAVINEGVLQQLGKPQEVYGCPANLFVAGFIGSPHMNLWDTGLVTEQDCCCLTLGERRIPVDKDKLPPEPWQAEYVRLLSEKILLFHKETGQAFCR